MPLLQSIVAALALVPAVISRAAANSITLPKSKPRTVREQIVVPLICSREVACAEWPNIRRFEHFL